MKTQEAIVAALEQAFTPSQLTVENESHMHNVPAGSESHFKVQLVCEAFAGKRSVQRHQAVYQALGSIMPTIHALALHTYTAQEWNGSAVQASPQCLGGSKSN